MEDKNWWISKFDDGMFLIGMFTLYFERNKMWKPLWAEIVGTRLHYRDGEWRSEYDELDGDFVECFILTDDRQVVRKCVLLSDFLDWQQNRTEQIK